MNLPPLLIPLALAMPLQGAAAPRSVDMQHIALDLRLDWPARQAIGSATLTLKTTAATERVQLDAAQLLIERITLDGRRLDYRYDGSARDGALDIALPRRHAAGETLTLRIDYRSTHVNQSDPRNIGGSTGLGLRWSAPTLTDPRKRRQLWASAEPRSARHWFPGIDHPGDWRSAELTATVDSALQVHAAGELQAVRDNGDGTRSWHWRAGSAHSNQHTLLIVGEYDELASDHPTLTLRNHGYRHEMDGVAASVPRLADTLDFFATLLGRPLPQPGYRQVFVPDFPWGQQAPGLAMLSENMVDDAGTHADFLYLWNVLQAEAAAAQWFGVHRGVADWRDSWLERGLARHLGGLYSAHRNGIEEYQLFTQQTDHDTLAADWAQGVREVLVPEDEPGFDFLTGNRPTARGAAVLHLLRHELGDAAWQRVLQRLAAGSGPIGRGEFAAVVSHEAGRDMGWFFAQWLQRADHPVFEMTDHHDARNGVLTITVHQRQPGGFFAGHVTLDIDGRAERVWLDAQADNVIVLRQTSAPRVVHLDRGSHWIKELRLQRSTGQLLHQLLHTDDTLGRHWAQQQLVQRAGAPAAPAAERDAVLAALRELVRRKPLYWRVRFNALNALRSLLVPTATRAPAVLDEATTALLLATIRDEGAWLRSAALSLLGSTRDARHAPMYVALLRDRSDRVITSAALALGRSGSTLAFDALAALPPHPSWKNQSLIAALGGLRELGDPRGIEIALAALHDVNGERWTLATPVWDHRLAAADTLRELGAGARGVPLLQHHLHDALASGHVNDSFYNLQLLVALADERAASAALQAVRERFGADPAAQEALQSHVQQLEAHLQRAAARAQSTR